MAIYHLHVSVGNKSRGERAMTRLQRITCTGTYAQDCFKKPRRHLD